MKAQKRNSIQISFPEELYIWITQKTEDPMNYTVNTYSGFVISCVEMVKAMEEKKKNNKLNKSKELENRIKELEKKIEEFMILQQNMINKE